MKQRIIVLEGLDGSGKTTQWTQLQKQEDLKDFSFITFPDYQTHAGRIITDYLNGCFSDEDSCHSAYSASSFYAIDRYISYHTKWRADKNVIAARYTSSNAIYQMAKLPRDDWEHYLDWLYDYEHVKLGIPKEDKVIFLDMPTAVSQDLLMQRYDGMDRRDVHEKNYAFIERCRQSALYLAEKENWSVIHCVENQTLKSVEVINKEICEVIKEI